ncbi:hypothetical protein B0H11DRAFT_1296191 [Mycena galericulata]|nr:hypothetical protein B0H11DRAFT_1296191 [Mycena galericulata]
MVIFFLNTASLVFLLPYFAGLNNARGNCSAVGSSTRHCGRCYSVAQAIHALSALPVVLAIIRNFSDARKCASAAHMKMSIYDSGQGKLHIYMSCNRQTTGESDVTEAT